ncbi:hypothetical protein PYW07_008336 [Mythimna separata]|uniref:Uncharacterized protein n=1 Tax=Mythimna separata TaxID=271217 RepID=A0AAD8DNW5_MYTSE|nr:hypothetical protein PYW07_008336 [Mythimna separata]
MRRACAEARGVRRAPRYSINTGGRAAFVLFAGCRRSVRISACRRVVCPPLLLPDLHARRQPCAHNRSFQNELLISLTEYLRLFQGGLLLCFFNSWSNKT